MKKGILGRFTFVLITLLFLPIIIIITIVDTLFTPMICSVKYIFTGEDIYEGPILLTIIERFLNRLLRKLT